MKVTPKDDAMRKLLKHPIAGAFPESGSADWPHDTFTNRRIRDGDITAEAPVEAPTEEQSSKSRRDKA